MNFEESSMEQREHERMSALMQARIFYGNMVYTGTVTNLSEDGMFIDTSLHFPVDSVFDTVVLQNGHTVIIPVRVKRTVASFSQDIEAEGIGVEVVTPPQNYLEFVGKCKSGFTADHS